MEVYSDFYSLTSVLNQNVRLVAVGPDFDFVRMSAIRKLDCGRFVVHYICSIFDRYIIFLYLKKKPTTFYTH